MGKGGGGDLGFGVCLASCIGEVDVCVWLFNIEPSKGESKNGCQGGPFGSGRLRWVSKSALSGEKKENMENMVCACHRRTQCQPPRKRASLLPN